MDNAANSNKRGLKDTANDAINGVKEDINGTIQEGEEALEGMVGIEGTENEVIQLPKTGPEDTESKKKWWQNLFGGDNCDHTEAGEYEKDNHRVTCSCGKWEIETPLNYESFKKLYKKSNRLTPFWKKDDYFVKEYVMYLGIDKRVIETAEVIELFPELRDCSKDKILTVLGNVGDMLSQLDSCLELDQTFAKKVGDHAAEEMMKKGSGYLGFLGNATDVVSGTIQLVSLAKHDADDIDGACQDFIGTVQSCVSVAGLADLPGVEGVYFEYFSKMLDALSKTLEDFFSGYQSYTFSYEVIGEALNNPTQDDQILCQWNWFYKGSWAEVIDDQNAQWLYATLDRVEAGNEILLPSVQDAINSFNSSNLSEEGKAVVAEYIYFRLDRYFRYHFGIRFDEYIKYLG